MENLNTWLRTTQESGRGAELYGAVGSVCTILMWLAIILYIWRQRINPIKGVIIAYLVRLFMGYAQHLMTWYRRGYELDRYFGTGNIGYAFVLLPLVCWLCDKTFNIKDGTSGELVAVTTMAWHFVGRSGCTFTGCCYGIESSWGVYSRHAGGITFPVCWVESLCSLAILIFLVVRVLRRDYEAPDNKPRPRLLQWFYSKRRALDDGRALPYMLFFYGCCRFFTEFLRHHPEEDILFGFLPEFSVHALLMAVVGGLLLYRIDRKEKAKNNPAEALPELKAVRR